MRRFRDQEIVSGGKIFLMLSWGQSIERQGKSGPYPLNENGTGSDCFQRRFGLDLLKN
jgi:hypothetical protein